MEKLKDIDLEELSLQYGLSVRAVHVCEGAGLTRLSAIRAFQKQQGGFTRLRNCGMKTIQELETLLINTDRSQDTGFSAAMQLPEDLAHRIYLGHVQRLSADARRMLSTLVGEPDLPSAVMFFLRYGAEPPHLERLKGPGRRELRRMSISLFADLEHARRTVGLAPGGAHDSALSRWGLSHSVSTLYMKDLYDEGGRMTLLHFLAHYLKDLDRRTPHRIVMAYLETNEKHGIRTVLANKFGVTREYVRQVLEDVDQRSTRLLLLLTDLPDVAATYPELFSAEPVFLMDQAVLDSLNANEHTRWSRLCVLHIMQAIGKHDQVMGSWATLLGRSHLSKELDAEQPFLIARSMVAPLRPLLQEMVRQYGLDRKAAQEVDLEAMLGSMEPLVRAPLLSALKVLLAVCLPHARIVGDRCFLPPNRIQFNEDRLLEVLEKLNEPTHVNVIREAWNVSYTDHPISVGGIRSLATRHRELFMCIGRSSMYGLARWQGQRPGLKGGSIRSIIADLLGAVDVLVPVEELEAMVRHYRPETDLASILQNLKLAREFKIYPGGYVGLSNKVYTVIPARPSPIPGCLMRDRILSRYIDQPRSELSAYVASRCSATPEQIERVIDKTVAKSRLVIDEAGIIRGIGPRAVAMGITMTPEAPFLTQAG